MVTARYLTDKFITPMRERRKAKAFAEGYAASYTASYAKGHAEGTDIVNREWSDWNNRRMEAREQGIPFDEPPPAYSIERNKTASHREIYAKGYSDGYSEGMIYGIRKDWYRRRMEAEKKGIPFDEPPPSRNESIP